MQLLLLFQEDTLEKLMFVFLDDLRKGKLVSRE